MHDARGEERESNDGNRARGWEGKARWGRSIGPFDRSGNSSTTQFALSRMTSSGFLVAIPELDTYLPAIWLIPDDPTRLSTSKPLLDILCRPVLRLLPHLPPSRPGRTTSPKLF